MQAILTSRNLAIVGLVLTSLFWAGNIFISKILVGVVPPFTLNVLRWLIAVLILTPFSWKPMLSAWPIIKASWIKLSIYGFLGVTIYNAFLYNAAYTTEGINIAVISTVTPLLTFIFVWLFFGNKPSGSQMLGFVFGIVGVLLLLSKGSFLAFAELNFRRGDLWMLTACLCWAIYTAYLIKKPNGLSPIVFMYITTVIGLLLALPTAGWEWQEGNVHFALNKTIVLSLIYIGLFPSVLSYLFFNYGVAVLGSQTAALGAYLIPIFTGVIGVIFLNESVYWFHIVSQILVFIGFYLGLSKR